MLQRDWSSTRVKGRDFYDFVWCLGRHTPVRLNHLEQRLRQTGGWSTDAKLTAEGPVDLLEKKFSVLDFELAKKDILPFIKDADAISLLSKEFFLSLLPLLVTV